MLNPDNKAKDKTLILFTEIINEKKPGLGFLKPLHQVLGLDGDLLLSCK